MARQPTKNRINMHDIIGQPLRTLRDAVDAVLRRPEALDEVEVASIFHETSYILLRAEEALSAKDSDAFCALFKLLAEGFAHSDEAFDEGIRSFAENELLLQTLHSIFQVVVEQEALPLHNTATVEFIQMLSSLCDGDALKDRCGAMLMGGLVSILERVYRDPVEARRHFHIQRGAATALINLVKGSKQNKQRLSSWAFAENCCAASVDVFFQLQCIELLFRVSRQNKEVLTSQLGSTFSPAVMEQLRQLPNDGTLLSRMMQLIQDLNDGRPDVLRYPVKEVVAAETPLTSDTNVYFTPSYLLIVVTAGNADNVTIPYRIIRSVTLGRDGRVILKLEEFPVKLEVLLSHTAGMDTVTMLMSPEDLASFKKTPVRSWIIDALQLRKEQHQNQLQQNQQQQHGYQDFPSQMAATTSAATPAAMVRDPGTLSIKSDDGSVNALPSSSATAAAILVQSETEGESRKKPRVELPAELTSSLHRKWSTAALMHVVDALIAQASTANEAQAVLLQFRRLIETRREVLRGNAVTELNDVMTSIQEQVDATRQTAKENRVTWHKHLQEELEQLDSIVLKSQEATASGVEQLNDNLKQIKASNLALNERIACLDIELQQTLEELRVGDQQVYDDIFTESMREAERLEFEMDQRLIHRAQSGSLLPDYLSAAGVNQ